MKSDDITQRLSKRLWGINNLDYLLEEASYHREHKGDFTDEVAHWWKIEDDEAEIKL